MFSVPELNPEITEAYYLAEKDNGEVDLISASDSPDQIPETDQDPISRLRHLDAVVKKSLGIEGSNQTEFSKTATATKEVNPPYDPVVMTTLSQIDEVAYSCSRAKAFDATKRQFTLDRVWDPLTAEESDADIIDDEYAKEARIAQDFLDTCADPYPDFQEVLYKAALDREIIGWSAIEVIRSADGIVRALAHVPASRVKPLKGWTGFKEQGSGGRVVYYQPFGAKVVAISEDRKHPITGDPSMYDPRKDGDLNVLSNENLAFNLMNSKTGRRTNNFKDSATELIWSVKTHPSTIYYGISDNLPALGHILANHHISNYLLQYFEHNTVPRYVVLIKGGRLDAKVKKAIVNFFRNHVKGRAHSTLVVPIPAGSGTVEIEFKELDSAAKDSFFIEVQKEKQHSIRLAHEVPAAVAGFSDNASLGSGKGVSQLEMYRDRYVSPAQRAQSAIITKIFKLGLGLIKVCGRFEELDVRNQEALMRLLTQYLDRGVLSSNEVRRIAKLGPPEAGGSRAYRIAGGNIIFTDQLTEMTSTIALDDPDDKRGGDQSLISTIKKEPENTVANAIESSLKGDQ